MEDLQKIMKNKMLQQMKKLKEFESLNINLC